MIVKDDAAQAARLIGLAQREHQVHGIGRKIAHPLENERTIALVREVLGEETYRRHVQEGEALPYAPFLSEALSEPSRGSLCSGEPRTILSK